MLFLVGCAPPVADAVLAYARDTTGHYAVEGREVPALTDPFVMQGELGQIFAGGRIADSRVGTPWSGGLPLYIDADVQDGVAIPPDEDGLLLYSFYAHLADTREAADAHGIDVGALFPVDMAFLPAVSPLLELQPMDNAAYLTGNHLFVLLPDGQDRDVPMLANAGVVRHEFGHAIFHTLLSGSPYAAPRAADTTTADGQWLASLHEGFADTFAALTLDDPRFIDASLPMSSRWMDVGAAVVESTLPADGAGGLLYDPYPLGTVFASVAWDLRLASDDPDATLDTVLTATAAWAEGDALDGWSWLRAWREVGDADTICASVTARAPGHEAEVGCP